MDQLDIVCTDLEPSESIVFFPSFGHLEADGRGWKVSVAGVILEPGVVRFGNRMMVKMFRRLLGVSAETLEAEIFQQRICDFAARTARGKQVVLRIGDRCYTLKKRTTRNGRFAGTLRFSQAEYQHLEKNGQIEDGWLTFQVVTPAAEERLLSSRVMLVPSAGLSVISDIDDTLKHSDVHDQDSLLANTFLREFRPIDGMSQLYRAWAADGAVFHYVSSSPWQLYRPLAQLYEDHAFPAGSFHLRSFRLRDHMWRKLFRFRWHGKLAAIKSILRTFPDRQFVLVGDSGEKDPELYGLVARKFSDQITAILIRQTPDRPVDLRRCTKAFRNLAPDLWQLFDSPDQLPGQLSGFSPTIWGQAPLATSP